MGYADGYYYGQGRIICDTSTFSVGDTIRVRSVYNALQTEDKQVVTVGTPLIFTVPPYDYYKICKVESNTEVGGEFVTIDYGQTINTKVVDKTTFGGIKAILNSHTEANILNIGDEVITKIDDNGNPIDWTVQIGRIDSTTHSVDFVSKKQYIKMNFGSSYNSIKDYLNGTFYNSMLEKSYIKPITLQYLYTENAAYKAWGTSTDQYVWLPSRKELFDIYADTSTPPSIPQSQFPIFTTAQGRIKAYSTESASNWLSRDMAYSGSGTVWGVNGSGTSAEIGKSTSAGIVPCFRLTADS